MGLFDFLLKRKTRSHRKRSKHRSSNTTVKKRVASLEGQIGSINAVLQDHRKQIEKGARLLQEHNAKIKGLEKLIVKPTVSQPMIQTSPTTRPDQPAKGDQSAAKFDIDTFSPQEKRILSVFFDHRDMALSYRDIASSLNKAPTTIKNQIHQILLKADILEKHIDSGMTNRFRLKDAVRIEKYLTSRTD